MRLIFILSLLLFWHFQLIGQTLSGKVLDARTEEPIAFANVVYSSHKGVTSDIDGRFTIETQTPPDALKISYVGYKTKTVKPQKTENLHIYLQPKTYTLDEVVVEAGPNPALRMIRNVIDHKKRNDPANYSSYRHEAYDKMLLTIHPDSLEKYKDRLESDTSFQKIKKFIEKQHFFISESVTRTRYKKPGKKHEKVIASRSSGFENPIFVVLISQLQSGSFYRDKINILDKNYVSPIASRAVSKYQYRIKDTLMQERSPDTTFIITYAPRQGTNFDGLKGMLYVNTNKWALQNIKAVPATADKTGINIKIEQQYDLIGGEYWFPVQLSTELFMGNVTVNGINIMGKGKRYLTEISINEEIREKIPREIAVDIRPDAFEKGHDSLAKYRKTRITEKEKETYRVIDSLGKAENFDRRAKSILALTKGKIPFKFFNIPINSLLRYNKHEGFYGGMELVTNEEFSRRLEIGGYGGYGFKDERFKYGGHATVFFDRLKRNAFSYRYSKDLEQPAEFSDETQKSVFDPTSYRQLLLERYDQKKAHQVTLDVHPLPFTDLSLTLEKADHEPTYDYNFSKDPERDIFSFTELGSSIRFAFDETFVKSQNSLVSLGTDYPIVKLHYARGLDGFLEGDYGYSKWRLEWEHSIPSTLIGETQYKIKAGHVDSDVPYPALFQGRGSYGNFTLFTPFSFSTMRPTEFLTNRFVALYLKHDFRDLLISSRFFSPSISLHHNMMTGELEQKQNHKEIAFKTPDKGYFESGVLLADLLKTDFTGIGVGFFYRYGPYQLENFKDNFAVNLSLTFLFN
ncbi:MAG: DUF5686 and carboxypeptidase regulatory-like domain-containing protein [Bacteroidales bacterium]|nr:DUF5686 and carboxypeptidase regulatory-like domain-containing protein [Bacteroidales bacterium]MCF8336790.1 DUF5686 and carboxypeptidase regulatory-like domain-containing protein [Bacteroidales bacterium]